MTRTWSSRSRRNMKGLHPDLIRVLEASLQRTPFDFVVTEGLRSRQRQQELFDKGASKTLNSRHLTGHAFDIAVITTGGVTWEFGAYRACARVIEKVASELGIDLEWGGHWQDPKDGPHYQLSWSSYPKGQWVSNAKPPSPRSAGQSRTVRGTGAAGIGALLNQGAEEVGAFTAFLPDDSGYISALKWLGFGLTMAGLGAVIYARLDDRKAGHF